MDLPEWPPITHPHTRARLLAQTGELWNFLPELRELMPQIVDTGDRAARVERALAYPWERPTRPCVIRDGEVHDDEPITDDRQRWPVVAIGANASPWRLAIKFRDLEPEPIRLVPATLHGYDVVASPLVVAYGSFPATLAESPGTAVRVALTWMTQPQIEILTLSEFGYWFGTLDGIELHADDGSVHDRALVYAGRLGAYRAEPGGAAPAALAAIPAEGRRYRAMTQRELLEDCALRLELPSGDALLGLVFDEMPRAFTELYPRLLAAAVPTPLAAFTPHPLT